MRRIVKMPSSLGAFLALHLLYSVCSIFPLMPNMCPSMRLSEVVPSQTTDQMSYEFVYLRAWWLQLL